MRQIKINFEGWAYSGLIKMAVKYILLCLIGFNLAFGIALVITLVQAALTNEDNGHRNTSAIRGL